MSDLDLDLAPKLQATHDMLKYSVIFFVVALVAAVFGFGGIASGAASVAQILFWGFLAVAIVTVMLNFAKQVEA